MTALCALAVIGGFTSCSDDDDYDDSWKEGSKVELPQYRAFILCEGTMGKNNSHLFFVDPTTDKPMAGDIYELQNGKKLGRPSLVFPANWDSVYTSWKAGEITAKTAMEQTGTKRTSFYKLVNMTENN